ncbi:MAG: GNAT family N-acetyltransferase [Capsulimonadales bacterium]|nr:GNAT family N-acetyltransferase [Capsulimonadales bacterium]
MAYFLETERLGLREFRRSDAPAMFALDSDPEVMRYLGPVMTDPEAARRALEERVLPYYAENPGYGFFVAEEKVTGAFLGWFLLRPGLHFRFAQEVGFTADDTEVGYRLMRFCWGRGLGTEGAARLRDHAFEARETACVAAITLATNLASRRVMEKIGLRFECERLLPGFADPAVVYRLCRTPSSPSS